MPRKKKYYIVQVEDADDYDIVLVKSKIFSNKKEAIDFSSKFDNMFLKNNRTIARVVEVDENGEEDIDSEW